MAGHHVLQFPLQHKTDFIRVIGIHNHKHALPEKRIFDFIRLFFQGQKAALTRNHGQIHQLLNKFRNVILFPPEKDHDMFGDIHQDGQGIACNRSCKGPSHNNQDTGLIHEIPQFVGSDSVYYQESANYNSNQCCYVHVTMPPVPTALL